jgi:hypothetical protein
MKKADLLGYLIYPNPDNASLTSHVSGRAHSGAEVEVDVGPHIAINKIAVRWYSGFSIGTKKPIGHSFNGLWAF